MVKLSTAFLLRGIGLCVFPPLLAAFCLWCSIPLKKSVLIVVLVPVFILVILDVLECHDVNKRFRRAVARYSRGEKKPASASARDGREKMAKLVPKKTSKRYLVVGTGGVGRRIIEVLRERGEEHVYGLDVVCPLVSDNILDRDHFVSGDVMSLSSCEDAIRTVKPDIVYHTAAVITYAERKPSQWNKSYEVNVEGVLNMLRASTETSVEVFILTSSSTAGISLDDCYRDVSGNEERFPPLADEQRAVSWYTRSKAMPEVEALKYHHSNHKNNNNAADNTTIAQKQPKLGIVRPASGIFHYRDGIVTGDFFNKLRTPVAGSEDTVIDYVYVDNVVLAHLLLEKQLSANKCNGETFIVSNREPVSFLDFLARLASMLPTETEEARYNMVWKMPSTLVFLLSTITEVFTTIGWSVPSKDLALLSYTTLTMVTIGYTMDDAKAERLLGYQPAFTVNEGLLQSIEDHARAFPEGELAKLMTSAKKKIA